MKLVPSITEIIKNTPQEMKDSKTECTNLGGQITDDKGIFGFKCRAIDKEGYAFYYIKDKYGVHKER